MAMNIFTEKEPVYAVAVLAAVLGWLVSTVHDDIGRLPVLEYHISETDGHGTLGLRNISRSQFVDGRFVLICTRAPVDTACFPYQAQPVPVQPIPPLWPQDVEASGRPREIELTVSLPASTQVTVEFTRNAGIGTGDFALLYAPAPTDPATRRAESILIVERSLHSRVLANYDRILITMLLLTVTLLVAAMFWRFGQAVVKHVKTRCSRRG
jgi:hypothetical protein